MGTDIWRIFSEWLDRWSQCVQEDEKFRPRGHKPSTQARFVTDVRDHSPDTKQLVKDVLAQLSRDVWPECAKMTPYLWAKASKEQ